MEWLQLVQTIVLVLGVCGGFVVYFLRDRPVRLMVHQPPRDGVAHQLLILTEKGRIFRQHAGPFLPEGVDHKEVAGKLGQEWHLVHSLPRKKGLWARLLNEFDV